MALTVLDQAEFADNPEPRCPVVLLLDTSGSMQGNPVSELNAGLKSFREAIQADRLAALRVEVAIIPFGGSVKPIDVRADTSNAFDPQQPFVTADNFEPPYLLASGDTPMGSAVRQGLQLLHDRKEIYKQHGIDYFRPWMFLITDGKPTDDWHSPAQQLRDEENRKGVIFFSVGVEGADMNSLAQFSGQRSPLRLKGLAFNELFQWLSKSLSVVAHSKPGEQAPLPPVGWAQIDT
jgi:uncharacterized protein YegL